MKRPRDHEPVQWPDDEEPKRPVEETPEKKRTKKPEDEPGQPAARTEDHPQPESSEEPDTERPHWRPERRREELAKALADVPEDIRYRFLKLLTEQDGEWMFERSRFLYLRLVREQTVDTEAGPVVVRERINLRREHPPRLLDPEAAHALAEETAMEDSSSSARRIIAERLPQRDQIEVILPDHVTVTIDPPENPTEVFEDRSAPGMRSGEVQPIDAADENERTIPHEDEVTEPVATPQVEGPRAAAPPEPEVPELKDDEVMATIQEIYDADDEPTEPAASEAPIKTDVVSGTSAGDAPTSERPAPQLVELAELDHALQEVVEALDEANPLPVISGASPEWDQLRRRHRHHDEDESSEVSERPAHSRLQRIERVKSASPYAETRILDWERSHRTPEQKPDARMKRKARKLVKVLARRYGLRLTPDTEAMLLEIVLAPRIIGGRKVYGLSLNREELLGAIHELWLHFPEAAPRLKPRP